MAERVADRCEERLGKTPARSRTADEPLPGGDFSEQFTELCTRVEALGLETVEAERVAMLYGSEALELAGRGLGPAVEAEFAVLIEGALTLEDYWVRRSARAHFDLDGGLAALKPAADRMARLLGWSEAERSRQTEACRVRREKEMSVLDSGMSAIDGNGGPGP
jgi:glycerol-3-phosphate dehydrogenase